MSIITEIVVAPLAIFGGCVAFTAVTEAFDTEEIRRKKQAAVTLDMSISAAAATQAGLGALMEVFGSASDGSGMLSSSEWGRAAAADAKLQKYLGGAPADELAKQFERIADGSKQLAADGFERGVKGLAQTYGPALRIADSIQTNDELLRLFKSLDKDGNERVSSKEWSTSMLKNVEVLRKLFGGVSLPKGFKAEALADEERAKNEAKAAAKAVADAQPEVAAAEEAHKMAVRKHKDCVDEQERATRAVADAKASLEEAKIALTPVKKKAEKKVKQEAVDIEKASYEQCLSAEQSAKGKVSEATKKVSKNKKDVEEKQQKLKEKEQVAASKKSAEEAAKQASESFQAAVAQVGKTFSRLDVDNSGDLTWAEFERGAAMVGHAALELGETENVKALRDGFRS